MLVVGLTGSIGMGKSAAASWLRAKGIGVFDADACVHALYAGEAVAPIEAAFPGTTRDGKVDRPALAAVLGRSDEAFRRLEAIVHPLVRAAEVAFLKAEAARGARLAVLEIPLLFETGADRMCDTAIVVSTDAATQRARVMGRPGMTAERLDAILARQMGDAEKRRRAEFVVDTSGPVEDTRVQIDHILQMLASRQGSALATFWGA